MEAQPLTLNDPPRRGGGTSLHHPSRLRSLLLWSGGVDSTYALLRLLRTTSDDVFSHHVRVTGGRGGERCDFEHFAIRQLRACLARRERRFVHTASSLDFSELSGRGLDSSILAFMAAQAAMTHGLTPFDRILIGVNGDRDPGWEPDSAACALRRLRMARALRAAWGCDEVPQIYLWLPRPDTAQMVATLGCELLALTVSCLQPVPAHDDDVCSAAVPGTGEPDADSERGHRPQLRACGQCVKCRLGARPGPFVDPGFTSSERSNDNVRAVPQDLRRNSSDDVVRGAAGRTPHLFRHLERLSNKKQALRREAAASDPPEP